MATAAIHMTNIRQQALAIPELTHDEAEQLAKAEFERVLAVVENISGDDWQQPTDCTEWNVRDMVAHLAGACAGYASWGEFFHQLVFNPYVSKADVPVDGINRRQLEDRADKSPQELIAEFREMGPKAICSRQGAPSLLRKLPFNFGAHTGWAPIGYLLQTIYTRDQWMHRADLCRATNQHMQLTPQHDGRLIELVLLDIAKKLDGQAHHPTVDLILTGDIELAYRFGSGSQPDATLTMDLIEFNRLVSERITSDEAAATIDGDTAAAHWFMDNCAVLY